jgi:serine/threonine protein kinase
VAIRDGLAALARPALEAALAHFERAISLSQPPAPGVLYLKAVTLLRLGRLEAAQEAAQACLAVDPDYEPALELVQHCQNPADAFLKLVGGDQARPDLGLPVVEPSGYEVAGEFSRGGMGRILRARDRLLGRSVAIKELLGTSASATQRFLREAFITARLQHPAIVPVYEAGRWPTGAPFYSMKLVEGRSLARVIEEAGGLEERLALVPSVLAVVDAVAYAHSFRIIHRDLKPENVLLGSFGETVVIDWGLAKDLSVSDDDVRTPAPTVSLTPTLEPAAATPTPATVAVKRALVAGTELLAGDGDEATELDPRPPELAQVPRPTSNSPTVLGAVLGTPQYMPPEQARGLPVDERADVYALGAMLYCTLTGRPPHLPGAYLETLMRVASAAPPALKQLEPAVPEELEAIVAKSMAREASQRYPSAAAMAEDLRRFQTGRLVRAHHYSRWQYLRHWLQKRRTAVIAMLGIWLVVLAMGLFISPLLTARIEDGLRARTAASLAVAFELLVDSVQRGGRAAAVVSQDARVQEVLRGRGAGPAASRLEAALTRIGESLMPGLVEVAGRDGRLLVHHQVGRRGHPLQNLALADGDSLVMEALALDRRAVVTPCRPGPLCIRLTSPVVDDDLTLLGAVLVTAPLDERFADHLKGMVGAEVMLGRPGVRGAHATSIIEGGGRRAELDVLPLAEQALQKGASYSGWSTLVGRRYASAFLPLRGPLGTSVGVLGVALPDDELRSVQRTTRLSILLAAAALAGLASLLVGLLLRGGNPGGRHR